MLVPQPKLILWAALVLIPFGALLGASPPIALAAALVMGVFCVIAALDAIAAPRFGLGIRFSGPAVSRFQKDQEGALELAIDHPGARARTLRVGLALPPWFGAHEYDSIVKLAPQADRSALSWKLRPSERGSFTITNVYVEAPSPLGWWGARTVQPLQCELRVYPDLSRERRNLAALFLRRAEAGVHAQRFAGKGREFDRLRAYQPGDSLSDIHWKASAKRQSLVSKVFQVEQTHEVYVVIDASRLSGRDTREVPRASKQDEYEEESAAEPRQPGHTALESYVTAALVLGRAAELQGDHFGLITFSDRILSFLRAKSGQAHFDAVRDRLYTLQPQIVSPDYEELCSFVRLRLRKRALLIVLTALDDPVLAESFVHSSDLISRQHVLLVNMLRPPGMSPLFENPARVREPGDLYEELAGHMAWRRLRETAKVLERRGVRLSLLGEDDLVASLIHQHGEVRRRNLV